MSAADKCGNSLPKDALSSRCGLRRLLKRLLSRYRANLLLLVALVVGVTFWFYYHIHLYFTQTLLVGFSLTLASFLELIRSFISREAIGQRDPLFKRLLGTPSGTLYIIFGLILITLFFLTTSSVYVEYDPVSAKGTAEYQVDVTEVIEVNEGGQVKYIDRPYLKRLVVSSYDRIKGRPYFFEKSRLRNRTKLRFTIVKPYGYEPNEVMLRPWSRAYFRVPYDFTEKNYHILRIMPGGKWAQKPLRINETDKSEYFLVIRFNNEEYKIDNILFETICIGAEKQVIESIISGEPPEMRYIIMRNHLVKVNYTGELHEGARILASSYRCYGTEELRPEDKVTIEVRERNKPEEGSDSTLVTRRSWEVRDTVGIQNVSIR